MAEYFDTDYRLMQLSVAVYLTANGVLHIFIGPLSDRYGRRPVILLSIMLFLVATIGCMLATTIEFFLAFRMAQAITVTGMVVSRAIVRDMYPQREAASMIGYVTMGMAVAPMIGPTIGGFLDEAFGWKAVFTLFIILGVGAFFVAFNDCGETATTRPASFKQQFSEYPELFGSRRFWGYCAVAGLTSGSFFAYLGGAPFVGAEFYDLSPARLGMYFSLAALGYMTGNFISGRYSVKVGINRMILLGSWIVLIGPGLPLILTLAGATHPLSFFGFAIFMGIGNGMIVPNSTAGMLSVRPHLAGTASGIGGAIVIGGGSGLSALSGALLTAESGPYPLFVIMLASVVCGLFATYYVIWVERKTGPLGAPGKP